MILSITVKEITFWNGNLIYVITHVSFTFDFKNARKRAQICDRCSLEYFAMLSRFHSRGRTHDAGSVTRIASRHKLTGFRINLFKNDLSVHYFVFVYSWTVGQSTVARQLYKHHFSEITANNCFQFWLSGPSLCPIVDFLVLKVFNSNNLSSAAVVGLKLFYPKSFRKQFRAFLKAPNFI